MTCFDSLFNYLISLPDSLIYLALGASAFVENVFPPIPGDTITAFGAFLVGTEKLGFLGVYSSTTLGSFFGFMALFYVGTYLGRHFFIRKDYRLFKACDLLQAEDWFRRYGYPLIALNRFLPGVRSVISLSAGISKLGVLRVSLLALASCSVWNLIWIVVGYELGTNWDVVKSGMTNILAKYNLAIFVLFGLVFLFWALWKMMKNVNR